MIPFIDFDSDFLTEEELLFLAGASGGNKEQTELPFAFSAGGGTGVFTPTLTNNYGTTINTTSAENNSVDVTQVPNTDYPPTSYRNGYICVIFPSMNTWLADSGIQFDADIDITDNPLEATEIAIYINSKLDTHILPGNHITATFRTAEPSNRDYIEIRCSGCDFTLSNCKITRIAKTATLLGAVEE